MLETLCCCTVAGIIFIVIFFLILGRAGRVIYVRGGQPGSAAHAKGEGGQEGDVIMTRCGHCGSVYDERLGRCPGCGGR